MLFCVVSTPRPAKPAEVATGRLAFLEWSEKLKNEGKMLFFYPRVGRGGVAVFDVGSNEELHELLTKWLTFVEVHFDVYPLVDPNRVRELLRRTAEEKNP